MSTLKPFIIRVQPFSKSYSTDVTIWASDLEKADEKAEELFTEPHYKVVRVFPLIYKAVNSI